jgi:Uncharacterized conserved protein
MKLSTRDLCALGVMTAFIAVAAQISIPLPYGVPFTMQTFAIPLAGVVLGSKRGTLCALAYLLLGVVGLPIFSGFTSGFGVLFGPTGGFILSFPLMSLLAGMDTSRENRTPRLWLGIVAGFIINFICGAALFALVTESSWQVALTSCVVPFLPTSVAKVLLVGVIGKRCYSLLNKATFR